MTGGHATIAYRARLVEATKMELQQVSHGSGCFIYSHATVLGSRIQSDSPPIQSILWPIYFQKIETGCLRCTAPKEPKRQTLGGLWQDQRAVEMRPHPGERIQHR